MSAGDDRAVVFIDGANLYAALKACGLRANEVDPYKVATKLVQTRRLVEVRYYTAEIERTAPQRVYAAHRRLRSMLESHADVRFCTGHIQSIRMTNACARELAAYLGRLSVRLPNDVFRDLVAIASRHSEHVVHREKGIDVALACDLVDLARRDAFDGIIDLYHAIERLGRAHPFGSAAALTVARLRVLSPVFAPARFRLIAPCAPNRSSLGWRPKSAAA